MTSMQDTYNELTENRELLSKLIKSLQTINRNLAQAEFEYRKQYSSTSIRIKLDGVKKGDKKTGPVAWTKTGDIARGLPEVAKLRLERDTLQGEKEAIMQKIYQTKIEIDLLQKEMEAISKGE